VDLHLSAARPDPAEEAAIDAVLGPAAPGPDGVAAKAPRHLLLPALHAAQRRTGYLSEGALNHICRRLDLPPAEAYGVATFYALFALAPRPPRVAHVCDDLACRVRGAEAIAATLERALGPAGAAGPDRPATWLRSPCLGMCEQAPAVLLQTAGEDGGERSFGGVGPDEVVALLNGVPPGGSPPAGPRAAPRRLPQQGDPGLRLLRRVGRASPTDLARYTAHGGTAALRRALDLGPEAVIKEVLDSQLVGRGGAAFPTGRKWEAVARAPARPHYLVCNADESEPGTFKDRILMEEDPFAILEAMVIAGFATGCERGFVYVRGEYPLAAERLAGAATALRAAGLLGGDILGRGVRFDVEIRRGAGAYICGEETALFNSIEGFRGEPRNKPPFPTQAGLFGKPTVVNNVETLANVLEVIERGGRGYAAVGTAGSTGTKLFCLSGHVARPGLYEVPFGTTLRSLLDLAGGVPGGRRLRAVLLGGAAGSFVTPDEIEMPLTFEGTRAAGASLGSGVVMAFDDSVDPWDLALRIAAFFRDESCGQCVPCRVGTVRQEEILARLARRAPLGAAATEMALLNEVAQAMRDASICGLGQTASGAVQSVLTRLVRPEEGRR
jgi:NADH-quinone oxidoreductase subunit F